MYARESKSTGNGCLMGTRTHFKESVAFRAPDGLLRAVTIAARREHTTAAEFLRRTVIARLREVGLPLDEPSDRPERPATAARG